MYFLSEIEIQEFSGHGGSMAAATGEEEGEELGFGSGPMGRVQMFFVL
jgi:hypothetical protein